LGYFVRQEVNADRKAELRIVVRVCDPEVVVEYGVSVGGCGPKHDSALELADRHEKSAAVEGCS
jgi:hypothetical protein